jgi:hypothetical protein
MYKPQGFQVFFYIAESGKGDPPTADYCKQVRAQYKLTMPVLYGPKEVLQTLGIMGDPSDWHLMLEPGGVLVYRKQFAPPSAVYQVLAGIFSD